MRQLVAAIVLLATGATANGAQALSPASIALATDSTAWQQVLFHVVRSLGGLLVQAAADSSLQPWRIELPAEAPQRTLLEAQLRRIVRARAPTDADSVVYALSLGPMRIVHDTARVQFRLVVTRRCPGSTQTTGWNNYEEILVPRFRNGFWGAARSTYVGHADTIGCRRSR